MLSAVDRFRFGRQLAALRRRRGWRQDDLAAVVGVSRGLISRIERGGGDRLTIRVLEAIVGALGARLAWYLDWQGERLDRLLDAAHAALVEQIVRTLRGFGWLVATEVSFNHFGERGSIDVLAFHPRAQAILVGEAKSVIPDVGATLMTLDRKVRLAPSLAKERGWDARSVSRLLIVREGATARRRVAQHAATFANAFPVRGQALRRWLRDPSGGPIAGLWFLSAATQASEVGRRSARRRPG
jgi:transcriptional regulator with XRE-family HTH domain